MEDSTRLRHLRFVLRALGLVFVFGVYPLTVWWPSGWAWHAEGQSHYLQMIIGIYATLGVFLFIAAKNPERHLSLISFTIWSSVVHGVIMAVQSLVHPEHIGHLYGDVLALFLVAGVLWALSPRARRPDRQHPSTELP
jgi:hypothetical protein